VIAVDPKWIDAAEEKAEALYLKGDLEAALSQSRRTLELNPGNVRMLELAYVALRDLNRDEDALRELDLELSRNPNSALAWYLKGAILLDRDERELAKESLERARQLDPDNPDVQIALSNALRLLGQYLEAGAWCESALNREGLSSYALRWAGVYFSEVGDFSRACKILSEAVRLYEDDPWLWSGYGWALQYRDDRSAGESVKAYEKALAALADEYSMWAKKGLADALFVAGQEEEASHRFRQVIEQWPDQSDRDVAYVHGWSHYRLGNYQQAAELLKCVAESSPDYLYARFDCGLARAAEGMLLEARQTYRRAIAEALSVHPLRRHGLLYVAQFDLVEAAKKNRLTHDAADLIEEVSRQLHSAGNLMTDEWLRSPWARRANT
jgi:tetratricopeptide (TPR) repeat protein